MPVYHCRSLHFACHESTADHSGDSQVDWMVDLYPKGVWFQKCFKIFTSAPATAVTAMKEVPERVLRTVRASVSTKNEFDKDKDKVNGYEKRVKIGVLVVGEQEERWAEVAFPSSSLLLYTFLCSYPSTC